MRAAGRPVPVYRMQPPGQPDTDGTAGDSASGSDTPAVSDGNDTSAPAEDTAAVFDPLPLNVLKGKETDPIVIRHGYMSTKWDSYIFVGISNKDMEETEAWETSQSGEITFTADDYVTVGYVELMNGHPSVG